MFPRKGNFWRCKRSKRINTTSQFLRGLDVRRPIANQAMQSLHSPRSSAILVFTQHRTLSPPKTKVTPGNRSVQRSASSARPSTDQKGDPQSRKSPPSSLAGSRPTDPSIGDTLCPPASHQRTWEGRHQRRRGSRCARYRGRSASIAETHQKILGGRAFLTRCGSPRSTPQPLSALLPRAPKIKRRAPMRLQTVTILQLMINPAYATTSSKFPVTAPESV